MFTLCQHFRSDGVTCMSNVIPLTSIWEIVQLVPVFGKNMDMRLNSSTSLGLADKFYLNNFANKTPSMLFLPISSFNLLLFYYDE